MAVACFMCAKFSACASLPLFETWKVTCGAGTVKLQRPAGRDVVERFLKGEKVEEHHEEPTMYPLYPYKDQAANAPNYAWGMAIDATATIAITLP